MFSKMNPFKQNTTSPKEKIEVELTSPTPGVTTDMIGFASFFDFLCAVFSRIAYADAPLPLFLISEVFDIIPVEITYKLSKIKDISKLNDPEEEIFDLNDTGKLSRREYNNNKYIDFMPYAKKINEVIEGKQNWSNHVIKDDVKVISIADSNYGDILVIGHKRLPNFVFTAYRGTYSAKTAASYSKPSSLIPFVIDDKTKALNGITKITYDIIYTTLNSIKNINVFLDNNNQYIPVFTGHSLGGAMATLMNYKWCNDNPNGFKPVCITFGSPRVLSKSTSERLCDLVEKKKTIVHRYSTDGDPVTGLPLTNFYHPCSSKEDKIKGRRKLVSRDCETSSYTPLHQALPNNVYTQKINCRSSERTFGITAMARHMTYLYVSFIKAANVAHMAASSVLSTEIGRNSKGETLMRIVQMEGNGKKGVYKVGFVNLVKLRDKQFKYPIDSKDNDTMYKFLLEKSNTVKEVIKDNKPLVFGKSIKPNEEIDVRHQAEFENILNAQQQPQPQPQPQPQSQCPPCPQCPQAPVAPVQQVPVQQVQPVAVAPVAQVASVAPVAPVQGIGGKKTKKNKKKSKRKPKKNKTKVNKKTRCRV